MGICLECAWKNGVSEYKKVKLISDAKQEAIKTGKYYCIVFDLEDESFEIMEEQEAKDQGLEESIFTTVSPH